MSSSKETSRQVGAAGILGLQAGEDVKPDLFRPGLEDSIGLRQRELEAWVAEHAPCALWLGLEDRGECYDAACPNVLLVRHAADGGIGLQPEDHIELETRLRAMVRMAHEQHFALPMDSKMQDKTHYVLSLAIDERGQKMVLLGKTKGPAHLIGKANFPGGKVELSDTSVEAAARRELLEETGIHAPLEAFKHIGNKSDEACSVDLVVVSCDISAARTMESEVVFIADIKTSLAVARGFGAGQYAPDLVEHLETAMPFIESVRSAAKGQAAVHSRCVESAAVPAGPSPTHSLAPRRPGVRP